MAQAVLPSVVDAVAGHKGVEQVILLSLVTASVAFAISEAGLFTGMREQLRSWNPWLGELASCGYCLGHWIAFGLVAIYQPSILRAWRPLDYFLTTLVIAWLAAFQWVLMCWMMEKSGK